MLLSWYRFITVSNDKTLMKISAVNLQLITYGATRAEALARMEEALDNYVIRGRSTFLLNVTCFLLFSKVGSFSFQVWPTTFLSCVRLSPILASSLVTSAPTSSQRFTLKASRATSSGNLPTGSCWQQLQCFTYLLSFVHRSSLVTKGDHTDGDWCCRLLARYWSWE